MARVGGTRLSHAVSLTDLPATLLALAGLPADELPGIHSSSLFSRDGEPVAPPEDRSIYLETLLPYHSYRWSGLHGLIWRDHKLIEGSSTRLYALREDPSELNDLAEVEVERVNRMRARLRELLAQRVPLGWGKRRAGETEEAEMLGALGYVAGSIGDDPFAPQLPDPAERIEDLQRYGEFDRRLRRAMWILPLDPRRRETLDPDKRERGLRLLREARSILAPLHEADPANPYLRLRLGTVESMLGNHVAAIPLLEQAVRENAHRGPIYYQLAISYDATGRPEAARCAIRSARAAEPNNPVLRSWPQEHAPGH